MYFLKNNEEKSKVQKELNSMINLLFKKPSANPSSSSLIPRPPLPSRRMSDFSKVFVPFRSQLDISLKDESKSSYFLTSTKEKRHEEVGGKKIEDGEKKEEEIARREEIGGGKKKNGGRKQDGRKEETMKDEGKKKEGGDKNIILPKIKKTAGETQLNLTLSSSTLNLQESIEDGRTRKSFSVFKKMEPVERKLVKVLYPINADTIIEKEIDRISKTEEFKAENIIKMDDFFSLPASEFLLLLIQSTLESSDHPTFKKMIGIQPKDYSLLLKAIFKKDDGGKRTEGGGKRFDAVENKEEGLGEEGGSRKEEAMKWERVRKEDHCFFEYIIQNYLIKIKMCEQNMVNSAMICGELVNTVLSHM